LSGTPRPAGVGPGGHPCLGEVVATLTGEDLCRLRQAVRCTARRRGWRLQPEAEDDLLQDVLLRLRERRARRRPAGPEAYLLQAARNATRDALCYRWSQKRDVRKETALPGELAEPALPPDLHVETPEEWALAREALREHLRHWQGCLPRLTCRALVLVYLVGFTCAEAAGLLGVPVTVLQSRLYRARQRLRERLP